LRVIEAELREERLRAGVKAAKEESRQSLRLLAEEAAQLKAEAAHLKAAKEKIEIEMERLMTAEHGSLFRSESTVQRNGLSLSTFMALTEEGQRFDGITETKIQEMEELVRQVHAHKQAKLRAFSCAHARVDGVRSLILDQAKSELNAVERKLESLLFLVGVDSVTESLRSALQREIEKTEGEVTRAQEEYRKAKIAFDETQNHFYAVVRAADDIIFNININNMEDILKRRGHCKIEVSALTTAANNASIASLIKRYRSCHASSHNCVKPECCQRGLAGLILYPKDPRYSIITVEVCSKVYDDYRKDVATEHQAALKWYLTLYPRKTFEDLTGYSVTPNGEVRFNSMSFNMSREAFEVEKELLKSSRKQSQLLLFPTDEAPHSK